MNCNACKASWSKCYNADEYSSKCCVQFCGILQQRMRITDRRLLKSLASIVRVTSGSHIPESVFSISFLYFCSLLSFVEQPPSCLRSIRMCPTSKAVSRVSTTRFWSWSFAPGCVMAISRAVAQMCPMWQSSLHLLALSAAPCRQGDIGLTGSASAFLQSTVCTPDILLLCSQQVSRIWLVRYPDRWRPIVAWRNSCSIQVIEIERSSFANAK